MPVPPSDSPASLPGSRRSPALGRSTTSRAAPASWAASAFSRNPPYPPVSLVTRIFASYCRSRATFSSLEKGPCIQMMFLGGKPSSRQRFRESAMGSTRGQHRSARPGLAKAESSLLPVVSRTFPGRPASSSAASAMVLRPEAPVLPVGHPHQPEPGQARRLRRRFDVGGHLHGVGVGGVHHVGEGPGGHQAVPSPPGPAAPHGPQPRPGQQGLAVLGGHAHQGGDVLSPAATRPAPGPPRCRRRADTVHLTPPAGGSPGG